ncbi:MAG: restriction endonuclease subunit S [Bacteroidaceae bacterium]|nr:restriction endonuclease subunit S [Bacteroidaceae bacterium]
MEDYFELLSGQDFPPEKYNDAQVGIPYIIGASNIYKEKIVINRWTQTPSVKTAKGDLLVVCKGAGVGKMALNDIGDMHIARQIQAIRDVSQMMSIEYIKMVVSYYIEDIIADANGLIPGLKRELLLSLMMPIPPLQEQRRIIATYEQLMSFIESIDNESSEVLYSIKTAKSKILDLAIHGKLVPQDPNDEPASELLKRINTKTIASCDNPHYEQVPFEIPSNWVWATLGDITNYGKCQTVSVDDIDEESWVLELEDIEKDSGKIIKLWTKSDREIKGIRHSFSKSYVLYSKLRTYLNKVLVASKDGFCTTEIIPIKCSDSIYPEYLCHVLRSKYFLDYTAQCGYGVKMPRLSTTDARKALVPLPPYEEQINISAKIKELYCSLDYIAEMLA